MGSASSKVARGSRQAPPWMKLEVGGGGDDEREE